ncbi:hypothetical protein AB0L00_31325 [Actinoallomurus sp. NPDC052308]|uniref:hypothetical protein n=1 Tax=Actinoallomurus sp. NPDC052308 TaxID=3155530 RepID=UPI003442D42E
MRITNAAKTGLIGLATAGTALTLGATIPSAQAATPTTAHTVTAAASSKCMWFNAPKVHGYTAKIKLCWNWAYDGHGAYNGVIHATYYDSSRTNGTLYVKARISNRWVATLGAGYEVSYGTHKYLPYSHGKNLAFRACLSHHGCGPNGH